MVQLLLSTLDTGATRATVADEQVSLSYRICRLRRGGQIQRATDVRFMRTCSVFTPPPDEPFALAELDAEAWVLRGREGAGFDPLQVRHQHHVAFAAACKRFGHGYHGAICDTPGLLMAPRSLRPQQISWLDHVYSGDATVPICFRSY